MGNLDGDSAGLIPGGTGMENGSSESPEEPQVDSPETVETVVDALKRLVAGSGKPHTPFQDCQVLPDEGRAYDGLVATTVRYPFGFKARLSARELGNILGYLKNPKIEVKSPHVHFAEGNMRFQLQCPFSTITWPDFQRPENFVKMSGGWTRRLIPTLPASSQGRYSLAGVHACPKGYVGTDGEVMGHVQVDGPDESVTIPRELIRLLPAKEIDLYLSQNVVWAETPETIWACPPLVANYPAWEQIFSDAPNSVVVNRGELVMALRAVSAVTTNVVIEFSDEATEIRSVVLGQEDVRTSASQTTIVPGQRNGTIRIALSVRRLLGVLDHHGGDVCELRTTNSQTHLYLRLPSMAPASRFLFAGLRWEGQIE